MFRGRRLACSSVLLLLTLSLIPAGAWAGVSTRADPAAVGVSSLPAEAKAAISAPLGRDQRAYHARREDASLRLDNPRHRLRVSFTANGVEVQSVVTRFRLRLTGLGRGARLQVVAAGTPEATANRVHYRRSRLTEWYVNGRLGLEHGFTLA